jgi:uncharacterized surface anchored protein
VTLTAGEHNPDIDAGIYYAPDLASLGDYVWFDLDQDGVQDGNETGVQGVTVTLYAADGTTVIATTTTDGNGFYQFTGLTPDTYIVGFSDFPAGYELTTQTEGTTDGSDANPTTGLTSAVTLAAGENNPNIDAGIFQPTASLGDYVWYDNDQDGIQDPSETGVEGVTVTLYAGDGTTVIATTTTDAAGLYEFTGLTPGTPYIVGFSDFPAGYELTTQTTNTTDGSDANPITGLTSAVTLAPGENNPNIDAGIYVPTVPTGSIGDFTRS